MIKLNYRERKILKKISVKGGEYLKEIKSLKHKKQRIIYAVIQKLKEEGYIKAWINNNGVPQDVLIKNKGLLQLNEETFIKVLWYNIKKPFELILRLFGM